MICVQEDGQDKEKQNVVYIYKIRGIKS